MKYWTYLVTCAGLLAACGFMTPSTPDADTIGTSVQLTVQAALRTQAPLPTAAPSATPAPPASETPTAEPSPTERPATPTLPATPDPNLNVGDEVYTDAFDGRSGWFWTFADDIVDIGATNGELKIVTRSGNNSWRFVVRSDLDVGDQQLRVASRTTTCPGNDEYGVMYRARFDAEQKIHAYIFLLNCSGQARVETLDDTSFTVLKDWENFPAITAGAPAENVMMIWMAHDQFHFYVNDQYLFSLANTSFAAGFYGFFVHSHSGGGAQLSFDDLVVRAVQAP